MEKYANISNTELTQYQASYDTTVRSEEGEFPVSIPDDVVHAIKKNYGSMEEFARQDPENYQALKFHYIRSRKVASILGLTMRDFIASDIMSNADGSIAVTVRSGPLKGQTINIPKERAEQLQKAYGAPLQKLLDAGNSNVAKIVEGLKSESEAA